MLKAKIVVVGLFIASLSACNGVINGGHNEVSIISEPSSASIYVMGELQGVTPMSINMMKLYPVTYSKEGASLYGHIMLRHEGCSDLNIKITNEMTGKLLREKLVCVSDDKSDKSDGQKALMKETNQKDKTTRHRLHELKLLKDDALITDDEYQELRSRILDSI